MTWMKNGVVKIIEHVCAQQTSVSDFPFFEPDEPAKLSKLR